MTFKVECVPTHYSEYSPTEIRVVGNRFVDGEFTTQYIQYIEKENNMTDKYISDEGDAKFVRDQYDLKLAEDAAKEVPNKDNRPVISPTEDGQTYDGTADGKARDKPVPV